MQLLDYIKQNCPWMKGWKDGIIKEQIQWYDNVAILGIAYEDTKIVGIGCARRIWTLEDRHQSLIHSDQAPIIWVDYIVADTEWGWKGIWQCMNIRWPDTHQCKIAFTRDKNNRLFIYDYVELEKKILNIGKYYGRLSKYK